jgi:hypothetical protein
VRGSNERCIESMNDITETKADLRTYRDAAPALYSIAQTLLAELTDAQREIERLEGAINQALNELGGWPSGEMVDHARSILHRSVNSTQPELKP